MLRTVSPCWDAHAGPIHSPGDSHGELRPSCCNMHRSAPSHTGDKEAYAGVDVDVDAVVDVADVADVVD